MTTREALVARVAVVTGYVRTTLFVLTGLAVVGVLALVASVVIIGGTERGAVVLAAVLLVAGGIAPVSMALFARDLGPVRRLPEITADDVRTAVATVATNAREGERRFLEARGLGRAARLGSALWGLRKDVEELGDGGLAPATALLTTLVPTRLFRVGISALASPVLFGAGLLALAFAPVIA